MSSTLVFWAINQELPANPKLVLIMLGNWVDDNKGYAWPSIPQLESQTSLSRSTIIRSIKWLVDHQLVTVEPHNSKGWKKANRYRLASHIQVTKGCSCSVTETLQQVSQRHYNRCQCDTTIIYTLTDTLKNTLNSGGPENQADSKVKKVTEVVQEEETKLSRDQIYALAKREGGKLTPKGCGYIWKKSRASTGASGFQIELKTKDQSNLSTCYKLVGEDFADIVWDCMSDWVGFTKHAEKISTAFDSPLQPSIPYFLRFIDAAADFSKSPGGTSFVQVTAPKAKPLTKPKITKDNKPTAVTAKQLEAYLKESST